MKINLKPIRTARRSLTFRMPGEKEHSCSIYISSDDEIFAAHSAAKSRFAASSSPSSSVGASMLSSRGP